jgi:uncharacterized lipoprotein YbaY/heat shock protein HslJ
MTEIERTRATIAPLAGTSWRLESYGPVNAQMAAVADKPATLTFDVNGKAGGSTSCNGFGGSYSISGDKITFGTLIGTLIACEDPLGPQDRAVLATLKGTTRYELAGGALRIFSEDGGQMLEYRAAASVSGTITYRQRSALPATAEIQVQLVDVSRADAPAQVIGEQRIVAGDGQVPFPFEIPYDPTTINPRNSYAIQARITVNGQLRFITTSRYAVITKGNPTTLEVIVEPV